MKNILARWYALSLPLRPPATTPQEREQGRYARLTAGLAFIIFLRHIATLTNNALLFDEKPISTARCHRPDLLADHLLVLRTYGTPETFGHLHYRQHFFSHYGPTGHPSS